MVQKYEPHYAAPAIGAKRILLVEDEPLIALAESKMLQKAGYECVIAYSGEQAVERIRGGDLFDLVLMDINLGPGMDGTEAAEKILTMKEQPIVFLSCHTDPETVNKTQAISSYGYIVKTSGEIVVLASIRMALKLYEARKELLFAVEAFRALAEMSCEVGDTGLKNLVQRLAVLCNTRYAFISLVDTGNPHVAHTMAVWAGSGFAENFSYDLRGTPCADVLAQEECFVEDNADVKYPADPLLKTMGIKSYWGMWLRDAVGKPVGVLGVMDTQPLRPHLWSREVMEIISRRVSIELTSLIAGRGIENELHPGQGAKSGDREG